MTARKMPPGIYAETRTDSKGRRSYRLKWKHPSDGAWQSFTSFKAGERDLLVDLIDERDRNVTTAEAVLLCSPEVDAVRTFAWCARQAIEARVEARATTRERYWQEVTGPERLGRWADRDIKSITSREVLAWVRELQERGLAAATIHTQAKMLRMTFRYALGQGWVPRDPMIEVPKPTDSLATTQKRAELHPLSQQDVAAIIRETSSAQFRVLWHVLAMTGMRIGEAMGLQCGSVDLTAGTIKVVQGLSHTRKTIIPTKTGKSMRTITLDPETIEVLRPLVVGRKRDEFVWHNVKGEPWGYTAISVPWRAAVIAAGLPKGTRLHDLRHAHATWLLSTGTVALPAVSKRLGHGSTRITGEVYAHVDVAGEATVQAALAGMSLQEQPTRLASKRRRSA